MPPNRKPAASTSVPSSSAFKLEARSDRANGRRQRQQKMEQDAATGERIRNTATVSVNVSVSESVQERKTRSKAKDEVDQLVVEVATNRTTPEGMNIPDDQGQPKSMAGRKDDRQGRREGGFRIGHGWEMGLQDS
jgi:hypothetical protein